MVTEFAGNLITRLQFLKGELFAGFSGFTILSLLESTEIVSICAFPTVINATETRMNVIASTTAFLFETSFV